MCRNSDEDGRTAERLEGAAALFLPTDRPPQPSLLPHPHPGPRVPPGWLTRGLGARFRRSTRGLCGRRGWTLLVDDDDDDDRRRTAGGSADGAGEGMGGGKRQWACGGGGGCKRSLVEPCVPEIRGGEREKASQSSSTMEQQSRVSVRPSATDRRIPRHWTRASYRSTLGTCPPSNRIVSPTSSSFPLSVVDHRNLTNPPTSPEFPHSAPP